MSSQNYTLIRFDNNRRVKIMNEVVAYLGARDLVVFIDESGYASYGRERFVCATHGASRRKCSCPMKYETVGTIHELTWKLFRPDSPLRVGDVIHHLRNKLDNRIKNLTKLDRSQHATVHNLKRQKHSFRERNKAPDLYQPRQPSKVVSRPDLKHEYSPPVSSPLPASFAQRLHEAEPYIALHFARLRDQLRHLDSGKPIPRSASRKEWRTKKTRKLGLRMPRLQCTPAEAAVALAIIKHRDSADSVSAAANELQTPVEFVREISRRVSTATALDRWARFHRLPLVVGRKRVRD